MLGHNRILLIKIQVEENLVRRKRNSYTTIRKKKTKLSEFIDLPSEITQNKKNK